ncbi:MAG: hypothetical protein ACRDMY_10670, partial [Gaiellaceae bacterium]
FGEPGGPGMLGSGGVGGAGHDLGGGGGGGGYFGGGGGGGYADNPGAGGGGGGSSYVIGTAENVSVTTDTTGAPGITIVPTIAPPEVTTAHANSIRRRGARLHGVVDPEGSSTTYRFEYGRTKRYGHMTRRADAGGGFRGVPVSALARRLRPATTYHFRIVATNAGGTVTGSDSRLRTRPRPGRRG